MWYTVCDGENWKLWTVHSYLESDVKESFILKSLVHEMEKVIYGYDLRWVVQEPAYIFFILQFLMESWSVGWVLESCVGVGMLVKPII